MGIHTHAHAHTHHLSNLLHHLNDPVSAVREFNRVSKGSLNPDNRNTRNTPNTPEKPLITLTSLVPLMLANKIGYVVIVEASNNNPVMQLGALLAKHEFKSRKHSKKVIGCVGADRLLTDIWVIRVFGILGLLGLVGVLELLGFIRDISALRLFGLFGSLRLLGLLGPLGLFAKFKFKYCASLEKVLYH